MSCNTDVKSDNYKASARFSEIYIFTHIYLRTQAQMYVCAHIYMCMYTYVYTCTYTHFYIHIFRMLRIWETHWPNGCLCEVFRRSSIANHIRTHAHRYTYTLRSWICWEELGRGTRPLFDLINTIIIISRLSKSGIQKWAIQDCNGNRKGH